MLKYLYYKEIFKEIPSEISLGISISGCQIRCVGCHSRDLWEDKGIPLTQECLEHLLKEHQGITCVCLFGGEHDIDALTELFMYAHKRVKTAWYSGLDRLPKQHQGIFQYLDWYKEGHFDMELGGLDSPTTNQRLYHITHPGEKLWDWTKSMQRNGLQQTVQTEEMDKMP
jgi:anaerobic ribonucleoside-triphosphate reductase activating protein